MQKRIAVHVLYSSGDENLGRYSVDQIICQNPPQSYGKHPLQIRFKKISSLPYPSDIKDTCVALRFNFSNREILDNRGFWIVSGFSEPADQGLSMRNIWMVDFYRQLRTVSSNCMACVSNSLTNIESVKLNKYSTPHFTKYLRTMATKKKIDNRISLTNEQHLMTEAYDWLL